MNRTLPPPPPTVERRTSGALGCLALVGTVTCGWLMAIGFFTVLGWFWR